MWEYVTVQGMNIEDYIVICFLLEQLQRLKIPKFMR